MATKIIPIEDIEKQNYYMQSLRDINLGKDEQPIACIKTFGCQMNEHDSEKISGMVERMGYRIVPDEIEGKYEGRICDLIVFNTCCIRENAEEKVFGHIGALKGAKRAKPEMITVVCGCMTEQQHIVDEINKKYKNVDVVFGTHNLYRLPEFVYNSIFNNCRVCELSHTEGEVPEGLPIKRDSDFKAWVTIMYGCNNFCTYCIVPYVRGRERSRRMADILSEIENLAAKGVREITLLGQNVNSYGKDLDDNDGCRSFADLLSAICEKVKATGLKRIRFMTSHPKDLSDELIDVMAKYDQVCKQLHLPVQAGSTEVLKKMNRRYTKDSYLALVDRIKAKMPDIVLSTDIIVGFPEETEEDFQDTLDLVSKVQYDMAYTFIYSPRVGTPAAKNPNQVPEDIVKERFGRLVELQNSIDRQKNEAMVGKTVEVLCEGFSRTNIKRLTGRTEGNKIVNFTAEIPDFDVKGKFVKVYIDSAQTWSLDGHAISWENELEE